jgi:hypothetical protein
MRAVPITVVETGEFLRRVKPLLSDSERMELLAFVGSISRGG